MFTATYLHLEFLNIRFACINIIISSYSTLNNIQINYIQINYIELIDKDDILRDIARKLNDLK